MFTYQRTIRMRDTDATGAIYFTSLLQIASEAFEELLAKNGIDLNKENFLLPIVHTSADYKAPIRHGDLLDVTLTLEKLGRTSITISTNFFKNKSIVAHAEITHVTVVNNEPSTVQESVKKLFQ